MPRNYLSKILHALVKEGTLRSERGPHGGFELAVASSSLTLFSVVRAFDDIEAKRTVCWDWASAATTTPAPCTAAGAGWRRR